MKSYSTESEQKKYMELNNKEIAEIYLKICNEDKISISYLQINFSMGFPKAKAIIEELCKIGFIVQLNDREYKPIK